MSSSDIVFIFFRPSNYIHSKYDLNIYLFNVGFFIYQQRVGYSLLCCFGGGVFLFSKTSHFVLVALILVFSFPYIQYQNCYFTPA